jgi:Co/Zn/Cd efflux system component
VTCRHFVSACVAGYEAVHRLIDPTEIRHLGALAVAGAIGFARRGSGSRLRSSCRA